MEKLLISINKMKKKIYFNNNSNKKRIIQNNKKNTYIYSNYLNN